MKLHELGEERLVQQLVKRLKKNRHVVAGPGDDCAVVAAPEKGRLLLFKTDCVVEGVHFLPNEKPVAVGWKAMARTLSDFAAMAGRPRYALVTLIAPALREVRWTMEVYRGLQRVADRFDVTVVGGETSSIEGPAIVSISAIGTVKKKRWVSRRGGKVGDRLYVTGRLGGSRRHKHLHFIPRIVEARWLAAHFRIHAMMDLSDGLGADLPRLAMASGLGFAVEEKNLPRTRDSSTAEAINDGEDYELLFAVSPRDALALENRWRTRFPRLPLTCIGRFEEKSVSRKQKFGDGYVHFQ